MAVGPDGSGGVRLTSSTREDSPVVTFTGEEWSAFLLGVRAGEFELDRLG